MKKTIALIIMDGYGVSEEKTGNAVFTADTANLDFLQANYPTTLISASGRAVGLPEGLMGNSEVGHLNMGAGRVVYQDITMIDKSIEDGDFFENDAFKGAMSNLGKDNALHLVGLFSDGGVHSSFNHLFALIDMAKKENVRNLYIHAITDGRDVPPKSALNYLNKLQEKLNKEGLGSVATIVGRYYYMDRDNRWERVEKGYNCVYNGVGERYNSYIRAVEDSYNNGVTDEFIEPIVIGNYTGVKDGDSVIFYNFRTDRAREISHAVLDEKFEHFPRIKKDVYYVGMTQYDVTLENIHTAFPPKDIKNTLGEYLGKTGRTQLRIAETEKYAHVTFFFNGGVEKPNAGEDRVLVASPKVATYDLQPEMSAYEVTQKAVEAVGKYDVIILNYANCDMVGHTGIFDATVTAVETVDKCVKTFVDKILEVGGVALLTADHGNAEVMALPDGTVCTSHTTSLVPFTVVGKDYIGRDLKDGCALCDIAPTLLEVLGVEKPEEMTGQSILK